MTGYRVEDFAADVVPFLDVLGIDRAVLAGHSGSCPTVHRVAIDRPEIVAGLVLEASPTTLHGDARLEEFVETVVSDLADPISAEFARSFIVETSSEGLDPKVLDQLVDELLKVPARVRTETFAGLLQLRRHPRTGANHRTGTVDLGRGRCARRTRHAGPAGRAHSRHDHNRVPRRRTHPAVGGLVALRRRCRNVRSDDGCDIGDSSRARRADRQRPTRHDPVEGL